MIGYVDVKTSPVYFHAQKSESHTTPNTVVPFEILRLNIGNAMSTSGLFVAPKFGKYFFAYSGLSEGSSPARVELQLKLIQPTGQKLDMPMEVQAIKHIRCKPLLILLKAIRLD